MELRSCYTHIMAQTLGPLTLPLVEDEHGVLRVTKSRVTVDVILYDFRDGATAEEIALSYPTVKLADIYAVLSYYLSHRAELDAYLESQEHQSEEKRQEVLRRSPQANLRERLRARLK